MSINAGVHKGSKRLKEDFWREKLTRELLENDADEKKI
jgi:hypothetical protein